jgi:hypothetical protein
MKKLFGMPSSHTVIDKHSIATSHYANSFESLGIISDHKRTNIHKNQHLITPRTGSVEERSMRIKSNELQELEKSKSLTGR